MTEVPFDGRRPLAPTAIPRDERRSGEFQARLEEVERLIMAFPVALGVMDPRVESRERERQRGLEDWIESVAQQHGLDLPAHEDSRKWRMAIGS